MLHIFFDNVYICEPHEVGLPVETNRWDTKPLPPAPLADSSAGDTVARLGQISRPIWAAIWAVWGRESVPIWQRWLKIMSETAMVANQQCQSFLCIILVLRTMHDTTYTDFQRVSVNPCTISHVYVVVWPLRLQQTSVPRESSFLSSLLLANNSSFNGALQMRVHYRHLLTRGCISIITSWSHCRQIML